MTYTYYEKTQLSPSRRALLRAEIIERDGPGCFYCGTTTFKPFGRFTATPHLDHVIPERRGGLSNVHNFVLACPACNIERKVEPAWFFAIRKALGLPRPPTSTMRIRVREWEDALSRSRATA